MHGNRDPLTQPMCASETKMGHGTVPDRQLGVCAAKARAPTPDATIPIQLFTVDFMAATPGSWEDRRYHTR